MKQLEDVEARLHTIDLETARVDWDGTLWANVATIAKHVGIVNQEMVIVFGPQDDPSDLVFHQDGSLELRNKHSFVSYWKASR